MSLNKGAAGKYCLQYFGSAAVLLTAAACATSSGPTGARVSSNLKADLSPGHVAREFNIDFLAGDARTARAMGLPASQGTFDILQTSRPKVVTTVSNFAVGSTSVVGLYADVVLTGKVCQSGRCISNQDAHSTKPLFITHLKHVGGKWLVWYPGRPK